MPSSIKDLQQELSEQESTINDAVEVLEAAYTPEATRSDMVEAISAALDILSDEEEEEDDGDGDGDDDGDDGE